MKSIIQSDISRCPTSHHLYTPTCHTEGSFFIKTFPTAGRSECWGSYGGRLGRGRYFCSAQALRMWKLRMERWARHTTEAHPRPQMWPGCPPIFLMCLPGSFLGGTMPCQVSRPYSTLLRPMRGQEKEVSSARHTLKCCRSLAFSGRAFQQADVAFASPTYFVAKRPPRPSRSSSFCLLANKSRKAFFWRKRNPTVGRKGAVATDSFGVRIRKSADLPLWGVLRERRIFQKEGPNVQTLFLRWYAALCLELFKLSTSSRHSQNAVGLLHHRVGSQVELHSEGKIETETKMGAETYTECTKGVGGGEYILLLESVLFFQMLFNFSHEKKANKTIQQDFVPLKNVFSTKWMFISPYVWSVLGCGSTIANSAARSNGAGARKGLLRHCRV